MTADVGTLQRMPRLVRGRHRARARLHRPPLVAPPKRLAAGFVNQVFADQEAVAVGCPRDRRGDRVSKSPMAVWGHQEVDAVQPGAFDCRRARSTSPPGTPRCSTPTTWPRRSRRRWNSALPTSLTSGPSAAASSRTSPSLSVSHHLASRPCAVSHHPEMSSESSAGTTRNTHEPPLCRYKSASNVKVASTAATVALLRSLRSTLPAVRPTPVVRATRRHR